MWCRIQNTERVTQQICAPSKCQFAFSPGSAPINRWRILVYERRAGMLSSAISKLWSVYQLNRENQKVHIAVVVVIIIVVVAVAVVVVVAVIKFSIRPSKWDWCWFLLPLQFHWAMQTHKGARCIMTKQHFLKSFVVNLKKTVHSMFHR